MRSLRIEGEREKERNRSALMGAVYSLGFYAACSILIYLYIRLGIEFATFGCIVPA